MRLATVLTACSDVLVLSSTYVPQRCDVRVQKLASNELPSVLQTASSRVRRGVLTLWLLDGHAGSGSSLTIIFASRLSARKISGVRYGKKIKATKDQKGPEFGPERRATAGD